jgi:hypothetical protein
MVLGQFVFALNVLKSVRGSNGEQLEAAVA